MALNDSLSDMLARIKNAHQANKVSTLCLKSKLNMNVLSVLKDEGYIRDFKNIEERKAGWQLVATTPLESIVQPILEPKVIIWKQ